MTGRFAIETVFKSIDRVSRPVKRMQGNVSRFTKAMERGFRRANRVVGKITRAMRTGATRVGFATVAALTGVGLALNSVADRADALAKRARNLKFPIEALQEWQFVAEQSGLSTAEFDKSLDSFAKRIGEARAGTGAMVTILKKMNPELLKQLKNSKNVDEALEIYIQAMRDTELATDKAALANAGFGKSGLKMVGIAELSVDAVKKLRNEQRENGVMTQQQAEAAEAYNDAVNTLKRTIQGFVQTALIPLMPFLTQAAENTRKWLIANKNVVSDKVIKFAKDLVENFSDVVKWLKRVATGVVALVALNIALGVFTGVMTAVNVVMAANPIVLITLAVLAFVAAAVLMVKKWEKVKVFFADLWDKLPVGVKDAFKIIGDAIMAPVNLVMAAWKPLVDFFTGLWDKITSIVELAKNIELPGFLGTGEGAVPATANIPAPSHFRTLVSPPPAEVMDANGGTSPAQSAQAEVKGEIIIRGETGRAEIDDKSTAPNVNLKLETTGAM